MTDSALPVSPEPEDHSGADSDAISSFGSTDTSTVGSTESEQVGSTATSRVGESGGTDGLTTPVKGPAADARPARSGCLGAAAVLVALVGAAGYTAHAVTTWLG